MKLKDVKFVRDATLEAAGQEDASMQLAFGQLAKTLLARLGVSRRAKVSFSVEVEFDEASTSPQGTVSVAEPAQEATT